MQAPDGYRIEKTFQVGVHGEVCAAVRESDGLEVVLKCFLQGSAEERLADAQAEFDTLRQVAGAGVPEAVDLVLQENTPVLVLERVPAIQLSAYARETALAPQAFLTIAMQLAQILAHVHAGRLIHRDVHPRNILVDPSTLKTHLIDFGLARPLGAVLHASELKKSGSGLVGTLAYISPEQTGRMGRGIDSRSDLYSLGASFYHALTGRPPFEGDDPLMLVHAHLAKTPPAPIELRRELPPTLSRIVSKLLQKAPEDRYQTAHALHCDLSECHGQLLRSGTIEDDFPLGTADAPYRPLFSKRLYGRDSEVEMLRESYAHACTGHLAVLRFLGGPGVGKSALVHTLRTSVAQGGGYIAQGKFDLYRRDEPYAGFIRAIQSFAEQILTESNERLERWRQEFCSALGAVARVVADLVPDFGIVLGETAPVPPLGPRETLARLALALQRFVQAAATPEHPLVLFLDDLQWSDAGSRELLRQLLVEVPGCALLLLCAYRDTEVDVDHPVVQLFQSLEEAGVKLRSIALSPLGTDACAQMLAEALGRTPQDARALALHASRKTGNVPLLIQQFVLHLYDEGLIHFEPRVGWTWDDAAVAAANIPDGAVALVAQKIARLEPEVLELLKIVSCIGDEFSAAWIGELTGKPSAGLEELLFTLVEEGILAPAPAGFRFVHDRLREAAQALFPQAEREALHQRIGRLLLEQTPEAELPARALEIADHLNHGLEPRSDVERLQFAQVNALAGSRALAAGATSTASGYLEIARTHFAASDWAARPELGFSLFVDSVEAAVQMGAFDVALRCLDAVDAHPKPVLQQAQVTAKRIAILTHQSESDRALDLLYAALSKLGLRWSQKISRLRIRLEILRVERAIRPDAQGRIFAKDPAADSSWLAPLILLAAAGTAMSRDKRLMFLASAYALRMYSRHGAYSPALPLSVVASFLISRGDLKRARRFASLASQIESNPQLVHGVRNSFATSLSARNSYVLNSFVLPWLEPRRGLLEPIRRTAELARESGDVEMLAYATLQHASLSAFTGEPLDSLMQKFESLKRVERFVMRVAEPYQRAHQLFRVEDVSRIDWDAELTWVDNFVKESPRTANNHYMWIHWIHVLCFFGEHARACGYADHWESEMFSGVTPVSLVDFTLSRGLASAALARTAPRGERRRKLRVTRDCLRRLALWAQHGPDVRHMALLLEAEYASARGDAPRAQQLYRQAARSAGERGYVHHAALSHERHADLLHALRRGTDEIQALRRAIELYRQWGAHAKVNQLESRARSV